MKIKKVIQELRLFWSVARSLKLKLASCAGNNCYCPRVVA